MLALALELAVNYSGFQRDVVMSDAYMWVRSFLNRVHYVATTQTNGIKRLADLYWEDALDITHKAHQVSNRYRKFAWSDPNGVIDFQPERGHHNKPGPAARGGRQGGPRRHPRWASGGE